MAATLTTQDLARQMGVTARTVRAWVASGMPNERKANARGGKPACLFDPAQAVAWIAVHVPGGLAKQKALRQVRASRETAPAIRPPAPTPDGVEKGAPEDQPPAVAVTRGPPPSAVRPAKVERGPAVQPPAAASAPAHSRPEAPPAGDTLLAMAKNLEVAERLTFGAWAGAVRENQTAPRDLPMPHSEVQIAMLMRNWHECVAKRKQLEREMPRIMMERGRYVDVQEVGAVLDRCVGAVCQDLDQVGISVADRCVNKSAREIREIVDEAVTQARRHIAEVWKAIGGQTQHG